ncbi:phosphotransferase family protein [Candidatus Bipolaricaulota bacterium]
MERFELDTTQLSILLGDHLGGTVTDVLPLALGASSRETPWRIDFSFNGLERTVLLRHGKTCSRNEAVALRAMEMNAIPTPKVLVWDAEGEAVGTPLFVSEFVAGESLLPPMKAGETWAIDLYIETACELQAIRAEDLPQELAAQLKTAESAVDVLNDAYEMFAEVDDLIEAAYRKLVDGQPILPKPQFSNGDLWPDNLLVNDRKVVGIIDWQHAGFSDPLFEFLLPFFLVPGLRGQGIEGRFCRRKAIDPDILHWYHGLEFFDSLRWVLRTGEPYEMHTAESLRTDLERWMADS